MLFAHKARCGVRSSFQQKSKWQTMDFTSRKKWIGLIQPTTLLVKKKKKLTNPVLSNGGYPTNLSHCYQSANQLDTVIGSYNLRSGGDCWILTGLGPTSRVPWAWHFHYLTWLCEAAAGHLLWLLSHSVGTLNPKRMLEIVPCGPGKVIQAADRCEITAVCKRDVPERFCFSCFVLLTRGGGAGGWTLLQTTVSLCASFSGASQTPCGVCVCIMGWWKNKSRILQPVTTGFFAVWRVLSTLSSFLCHWLCCCKWATQDCVIWTIQRPGVCAGEGSELNQTRRKQNPGRKGICSPWLLLPLPRQPFCQKCTPRLTFPKGAALLGWFNCTDAKRPPQCLEHWHRGCSGSTPSAQALLFPHLLGCSEFTLTPFLFCWHKLWIIENISSSRQSSAVLASVPIQNEDTCIFLLAVFTVSLA